MKNERFLCIGAAVIFIVCSVIYSSMCYNGEITFAKDNKIYYDNVEMAESFDEFVYKSKIVNINTDGIEKLDTLKGIGEKTAQKIIDYRENNGGFKSIEEIMNVDGIGEKTFEDIKEYIVTQ